MDLLVILFTNIFLLYSTVRVNQCVAPGRHWANMGYDRFPATAPSIRMGGKWSRTLFGTCFRMPHLKVNWGVYSNWQYVLGKPSWGLSVVAVWCTPYGTHTSRQWGCAHGCYSSIDESAQGMVVHLPYRLQVHVLRTNSPSTFSTFSD